MKIFIKILPYLSIVFAIVNLIVIFSVSYDCVLAIFLNVVFGLILFISGLFASSILISHLTLPKGSFRRLFFIFIWTSILGCGALASSLIFFPTGYYILFEKGFSLFDIYFSISSLVILITIVMAGIYIVKKHKEMGDL